MSPIGPIRPILKPCDRRCRILLVIMMKLICILIALCLAASVSASAADLRSRIRQETGDFKDISLTCKVLQADHDALRKIGKDFPKSYEFKSTLVRFKAPDKMKMEGKLGMVKIEIIINGNRKITIIPPIHYRKREDISDKPHKRQTDLDVGMITDSLWRGYIVTSIDDDGPADRITFCRENSKDKKLVAWVDDKSLKLLKVEKYESDGRLISRYIYSGHSLINGVAWVPSKIQVYNCDGKLAGTTSYENIKINTGIPDSVFDF